MKRNIPLYYFFTAMRAGLFFIPIWISYQSQFLNFTQIAFFASLQLIITMILELPTGVLADLIGKKYTLLIGTLINSISFLILGLFPTSDTMIIYALLNGLGIALVSGANSALLYDTLIDLDLEDDYPKYAANANFIFQITGTLAILSGGYLYNILHSLPYYARSFTLFLALPALLFIKEPITDSDKFNFHNYIKQTIHGAKESFKTPHISKLSILYILVSGIAISNQRFFSQAFMEEVNMSPIDRSWTASAIKLIVAFTTIYLARNKKLLKSRYYLLLLPTIMIITLLPIQFLPIPLTFLALIGIAFPSGTNGIFIGHTINQHVRSRYRTTALSTLNMLAAIIWALNNMFGSYLSTHSSIGQHYFYLGLFTLLIIIPLTLNIINSPTSSSPSPSRA